MSLEKIIVTIFGMGLVAFIYWFFFSKKENAVEGDNIDIVVDGGYKPARIKLQRNVTTKLNFTRKDPNSCLEEIIFPDFNIKEYLPLNKTISIDINPKVAGEYEFHCGMNMYRGKITVK